MTVIVLSGIMRLLISQIMESQILKSDILYQNYSVNAYSLGAENTTIHTEHNWDEGTVIRAATCAEDGIILYRCAGCGTARNDIIPATGEHKWDRGVITRLSTCTRKGIRTLTCKVCGETMEKNISKNPQNHTAIEVRDAVEVSCLTDGYTGDTYCKGCGVLISEGEVIECAGEHKWDRGIITRLSTCTRKGIRTLTCKVCGETMEKNISKNPQNHVATEVRDAVEAGSYTDGYTGDIYCTACGMLVSEGEIIPAMDVEMKTIHYRALLIGETGYSTRLNGPENDIACMNTLLNGISNRFEVYAQQDASMDEVLDLIDIAFENATEDDVSLFYYSGHGVTNSGEYYSGALQTVDYRYITTFDLAEMLSGIPGKIIVILDSCGSGATIYDGDGDEIDEDLEVSSEPNTGKSAEVLDFDPEVFNDDVMEAFEYYDPGLPVTPIESTIPGILRSGELRQSKFSVITSSSYEQNSQTTFLDGIWGGVLTRGIADAVGCRYPGGDYLGDMPADFNENSSVSFMELADYCIEYVAGRQKAMCYYGSGDMDLFIRDLK